MKGFFVNQADTASGRPPRKDRANLELSSHSRQSDWTLCSIPVPSQPVVEGNTSAEFVAAGLGWEVEGLAPGHRHVTTLETISSPPDTAND